MIADLSVSRRNLRQTASALNDAAAQHFLSPVQDQRLPGGDGRDRPIEVEEPPLSIVDEYPVHFSGFGPDPRGELVPPSFRQRF